MKLGLHDSQHKWHSKTTLYHYAECHYAECHYAECRFAECRYAECHYAECHYAECRYAECRGTRVIPIIRGNRIFLKKASDIVLCHFINLPFCQLPFFQLLLTVIVNQIRNVTFHHFFEMLKLVSNFKSKFFVFK